MKRNAATLSLVDAATVSTQGSTWFDEPASGPSLPAEAATNVPAATALRNATETESLHGETPPLIEKLMTSALSMTAWFTACEDADELQPLVVQTRYAITLACGAMPEIVNVPPPNGACQ